MPHRVLRFTAKFSGDEEGVVSSSENGLVARQAVV